MIQICPSRCRVLHSPYILIIAHLTALIQYFLHSGQCLFVGKNSLYVIRARCAGKTAMCNIEEAVENHPLTV